MATTDVEALMLRIEASSTKLEKDLAKANKVVATGLAKLEKQARDHGARFGSAMGERLTSTVAVYAARLGGVVAAAFSADQVITASQAYIRATNSLKVAGLEGAKLKDTFGELYAIAQKNSVPIETLTGLYGRLSTAKKELGASDGQLIAVTTAVAQSLRVSGQSAEEAQGALLQLGQALAGGTVQAEEYNSLLDGARPLLEAAAAGLKEAGGSVAALTKLVKDGEVSSKALFFAILAGAPVLEQKLAGATKTAAQAWTEFQNALTKAAGEIDTFTGATTNFTDNMSALAGWLGRLPELLDASSAAWASFKARVNEAAAAFNSFMGYDEAATRAAGLVPIAEARADAARASLTKSLAAPKADRGRAAPSAATISANARIAGAFDALARPSAPIETVSIKDFPSTKKAKGVGGGAGEAEDEYDRAIRKTQEHVEALKVEIETLGWSTEAKQKAKTARELLTAAEQADIELTPARRAEIEKVSAAYAAQVAALEQAKAAHESLVEAQRFAGQSIAGFFSDIVSGGRNAEEALMNVVKKLADAALQAALLGEGPLAGLLGLKSTTGGVGGLIGALFSGMGWADGGYTGPGGKYQPAGIVHAGEYVVPASAVRRLGVGNLDALTAAANRGYAAGGMVTPIPIMPSLPSPASMVRATGGVSIVIGATHVDASGADPAAVVRLEQALAARDRALKDQVRAIVVDAQKRGRIK